MFDFDFRDGNLMLTKEGKNMFDFDCRDDLRAEKIMLSNKQGKSLISIFSTW